MGAVIITLMNIYDYFFFTFLFITIICAVVELAVYHFLKSKYKNTSSILLKFFSVAHIPLQILIWSLFALTILKNYYNEQINEILNFSIGWDLCKKNLSYGLIFLIIIRFLRKYELDLVASLDKLFSKKGQKNLSKKIYLIKVVKVVYFIIIAIFLIFALSVIGFHEIADIIVSIGSFSALITVAISFVTRDVFAEYIGGWVLKVDKPFKIGDWIRSSDGQIEGYVEDIRWRITKVRTLEKVPLYVPNSAIVKLAIENKSSMSNRRIKTVIGIRYQDANKMASIVQEIEKMLKIHPEIDQTKTCSVTFDKFGPSSLDFLVYTFTKATKFVEFRAVQQDIFFNIIDIIEKNGAECAFPTSVVHLESKKTDQY